MTVGLVSSGLLAFAKSLGVVMGAELGTCVDTLLSTIGQTRAAIRTGVFQLLFNLFNVFLLVGFAEQLAHIAQSMTKGSDATAVAKQIAHAHVMFNCFGVLVALPFTDGIARGMLWLIPDKTPVAAAVPISVVDSSADPGPTPSR